MFSFERFPFRLFVSSCIFTSVLVTQIKSILNGISGIAITTDGGTNNRTKHYQAITGHFLDNRFNIHNVVLDLVYMDERSTADNLVAKIRQVLESYSIDERKVTAVCDNAANIVAALGSMNVNVVRCACHTLQLAVLDALKDGPLNAVFSKIRDGVKKIRDSVLLSKIFEDLQRIDRMFDLLRILGPLFY